jgi:hypothetical protein
VLLDYPGAQVLDGPAGSAYSARLV